jgi:hypothetical protein
LLGALSESKSTGSQRSSMSLMVLSRSPDCGKPASRLPVYAPIALEVASSAPNRDSGSASSSCSRPCRVAEELPSVPGDADETKCEM